MVRVLHYSDVENAHDRPERIGRLAGTLDRHRDDETLVVGSGDDTGPGALALETGGRGSLPFFERVAPDAETFGNHDFDHGLAGIREVVRESPVAWVSANVRVDGERVADVDRYRVFERGGESVAVVGVSDPQLSLPRAVDVSDPVAAVASVAADADADWLVALAHTRDDTAREIARATPADAVLAGHVHSVTRECVAGTPLVRPGANGRVVWEFELGESEGESGGAAGESDGESSGTAGDERIAVTRHDVPEGPLDDGMAKRQRERLAEAGLAEVVATVDDPIERDRAACLRGECRLANLVTDALCRVADADIAHVDTRGLRDGPPIGPEVTVADLVGVAPFEAGVFVATVTGREVSALVEESHRTDADGRDGAVWTGQFGGLAVERERAGGEPKLFVHGGDGDARGGGRERRPLDPDGEYRLVTNGYVVYTDEFETVGPADARELHGLYYEAIVTDARRGNFDPALDGRLPRADS
jgi:2',3'-cyclic-nucleotide 2'-phosphodiesterase (5'-nucleotidase family)